MLKNDMYKLIILFLTFILLYLNFWFFNDFFFIFEDFKPDNFTNYFLLDYSVTIRSDYHFYVLTQDIWRTCFFESLAYKRPINGYFWRFINDLEFFDINYFNHLKSDSISKRGFPILLGALTGVFYKFYTLINSLPPVNFTMNNHLLTFLNDLSININKNNTLKLYFILHYVFSSLFLIIGILIAVAFFTLLERKVMASMQRRKGPDNKISGRWGILQPLADGLKLLSKEIVIPKRANIALFIGAPMYTFLMSLMSWAVIPWSSEVIFSDPRLSSLYVFAISSLGVYGILLAGWSSNSKYAFLGGLRSAAQMISYEVSLGFILIIIALISGTYNFREIVYKQETIWYCFPLFPLVLIFFVSMLAETNRAPFDLPEAEAELVSGYNTEYSSMVFAMFFLGEYSSMLLMASLFVIFFFGGWLPPFFFPLDIFEGFWFFIKIFCVSFAYVWVRATLPRYRYNQLMSIGWKIFLPLTFGLLFFYSGILFYLDGLPIYLDSNLIVFETYVHLREYMDIFLYFKNYKFF